MATNIGSILAQSGATAGQLMGGGIANLGAGLSSGIGGMLTNRRKAEEEAEAQQLLQQYSNDPAQLRAIAQKYATEGNSALSGVFSNAAEQSIASSTRATLGAAVAGIKEQDPTALFAAGRTLIESGSVEQGFSLIQKAEDIAKTKEDAKKVAARKVALARRATDLGLLGVVTSLETTSDLDVINDIAKDLRAEELKRVGNKNPVVRQRIAELAGISADKFKELGLADVSEGAFDDVINGEKGEITSWLTAEGNIKALRENTYAMVYDVEAGKWTQPSELGLTTAPPQVQKVEQIASQMGTELAKVGAKNFTDMYDQATKAVATIETVDSSLPLLDDMFTGAGAELKLNINRYAEAFGIDLGNLDAIANNEVYLAKAATRVAEYIVNLGAGTGLSDKDREFSEAVVGGRVASNAESLKRILKDLKRGAENKVNSYNSVRQNVMAGLGENQVGVMTFFPSVTIPEAGTQKVQWSDL
jgi:hypothetical protein